MKMDIMCRLFFILLASLDFGCHVSGQTSEMVQNTRDTNTTTHTQQQSHHVIQELASDEHPLQTSSSSQHSLRGTTVTSAESETSQHTTDLPHRTELSQPAAEYSLQTSENSQLTQKYSSSASLESQISSEQSHYSVTSANIFVTSVLPVSEQTLDIIANNENPSETQIESSQRTVWVLTNSESSSREKESTDEGRSQSSSKPAIFSATEPSSTQFNHSEHLTVETTAETTEYTDRTFHLTSFQKTEMSTDVSAQENESTDTVSSLILMTSHATYSIHSHHVTDLLPSETGYSTAGSESTVLSHMKESSSRQISSSSYVYITDLRASPTQSESLPSKTIHSSDFTQVLTYELNTIAIVTSPRTESHVQSSNVSESSGTFVIYSSKIQSDMSMFSDSLILYTNSTVFVNASSVLAIGKVAASASNISVIVQSETENVIKTSLPDINQSKIQIADTQETDLFNSSMSSTEASILSSSYRIFTEVSESLSSYSQNITQSSSLPLSVTQVTQVEQNTSSVFTKTVEASVISPSRVLSELTSSLLHKEISPTSVYQSVNASFISDIPVTSYTSTTSTTTMKTSSFRPSNKTTTTAPRILEIRDIRFLFEFSGNCHLIQNNSLLFGEFIIGLVDVLSKKLVIPKQKIKPDNFSCGSLKIYVTFLKVPYHYITHILKNLMSTHSFIVKIYLQNQVVTFDAIYMKEVKLLNGRPGVFDMPQEGLDKVDIIVIIVACCICGILLSIGGILCIKECYRRKYAQSFDLMEVPHVNLKLEDFTLTRIPRPKTIYNEDNVTIQSFSDSYGQHVVRGVDHQSKSNNGVHVRMNKNTDGIVIGVVRTSKKNGNSNGKKSKWHGSASSESSGAANPSLENLLPSSSDSHTTEGALNPVFLDDQCASSTNNSYPKHT